ncbi:hypothetical protein ANCDUO_10929 [Ancylostoma duodenale]|uniref:Glycosyltransferase family 92 protein n=1 Tax=Ancylostoma duodenale TaxID=51022 RepID=A0A0C2GPH9_9BILA|nr:hypothetical protein ANCDUO_10929 [Ancylostoma duodenale]
MWSRTQEGTMCGCADDYNTMYVPGDVMPGSAPTPSPLNFVDKRNLKYIVFGALITSLGFLMFVTTNISARRSIGYPLALIGTEKPNHVKECIPFYALMEELMKSKIGIHGKSLTSLSLVGAYAYDQYSVVTTDADGWFGAKVYCRYFDRNWVELKPPVESYVFPEYVVHCCKDPEARYMSISETEEEIVKEKVAVVDRTANNLKYQLTFCLPPIYGNESIWLLLAELVEHYKLQGVDHFYFYIKDIDAYSLQLIENYVKNGEADAIFLKEEQDREGFLWQLVGVRGEKTLRDHLPTLVYHNTSGLPDTGFVSKCVVDCAKVLIMAIHWIKAMFPPYQEIYAPREEILIM